MSTKIYDGMIATTWNTFELNNRIRGVIEPMFKQKYFDAVNLARKSAGQSWADVFQLRHGGKLEEKWDFPIEDKLWDTPRNVWQIIEDLRTFPARTFSDFDFGYSISVLENGIRPDNPALVLLFSEREAGDEYRKALFGSGVVREYGYWNNTDQPEFISDAEWEDRKKAWSLLDVPADQGYLIQMLTPHMLIGEYITKQIEPLTE